MRLPKFNIYVGGGYWLHLDGKYAATIKVSIEGWYGGAMKVGEKSVPLHGPYKLKRRAKKRALAQLALLLAEDNE